MKKIIIVITVILFLIAFYLTFLAPSRFGTHSDKLPCGQNSNSVYHYTATDFFLRTNNKKSPDTAIGTCPYQQYEAKTFALEIWAGFLISTFLLYRKS